jgi:hypothetical protein
MSGESGKVGDPLLVTTDYPLLLKIKLDLQIYKNRAAREGSRGNNRNFTDFTTFTAQAIALQYLKRLSGTIDGHER